MLGSRSINRLQVLSKMSKTLKRNPTVTARQASSTPPAPLAEDWSLGRTYRFQRSIPHLPVPTLAETAAKYLKSVHAVVSPHEYAHTEAAVKEFIKPGGQGEILQKRLEERAAKTDNWIYDWWNDAAYLTYKDPVVPYVSYFYAFKDDKLRRDPARRAAAITKAALIFASQVEQKTLEPEYMRKEPLCMDSYKYMFHCCRIPDEKRDYPKVYNPQENKHIVVIRRNHFYKLPYEIDGSPLSAAELEAQFRYIYDDAASHIQPFGALTNGKRDFWAKARKDLIAVSPENEKYLQDIESAAFVVALDDKKPVTAEERAHQFWHGDGKNRWSDKPCQFFICDNGVAGFQGEHSMMDGSPTCRLNDEINGAIFKNTVDYGTSSRVDLEPPKELRFKSSIPVDEHITKAVQTFNDIIGQHEVAVLTYQGYGKNAIKKFKASPDAFIQMIIQLGYYKFYGVNRPTYESASVRKFLLGRTETCRSVSDDSVAFCKLMEDPSVDNATKIAAARKAITSHVKYISDASDGKGCDRHLFGLKKEVKGSEPVPAIFADKAYSYSSSWFLSTSQLSSEYFNGYGWSQVIDGGFGIAYMINGEFLNFNIASKNLGSEKLRYYIKEAADDMYELFSSELAPSSKL